MSSTNRSLQRAVGLLAGVVATAALGQSQGLIQTQGQVIAANDQPIPGVAGAVFGGTSTFDSAVLDESGNAFFRAKMFGASTPLDERALYYGSNPGNLILVIRGADPAPGIPGATLNTATLGGIGSGVRLSPDGEMLWGSSLSGGSVTTADDTAIFVGTPGNFLVLVREGDAAPGTVGASFSSSFNSPSQQSTALDRSGRALFKSSLSGGDVSGSTNNEGWFIGTPGNLQMLVRKGDSLVSGEVISSLGFVSQTNEAGEVLFETSLSTSLGAPPATVADDRVLWIHVPGTGNVQVLREGDAAPGTVGATFNNATNFWSINVSACAFNNGGNAILVADLLNGDVVAGQNDRALYSVSTTATTLLVRRGEPAPGTDADLDVFNNSSLRMNNNGMIAFQSSLVNGTATAADDSGIWAGQPGALSLVAREGDPAPGTSGGEIIGSISGQSVTGLNDKGQLLFNLPLVGGAGGSALYMWDITNGLLPVVLPGDQIETLPGVFKSINSFGGVQFTNGNDAALSFGHDGRAALRIGFSDTTGAIVSVDLPDAGAPTTYCTAKVNSQGCLTAIGFNGTPSVSAGSGFQVTASNIVPSVNGMMIYSKIGPASIPIQGGFLCVGPFLRTFLQGSGGQVGVPCSGTYQLDFNAYIAAGFDPLLVLNTQVWAQYWSRDPASPSGTNLTDGLSFTIGS